MGSVGRVIEPYGDDELQVGEWFVPAGDAVGPTVVLIHGGFWRPAYDRHLEDAVATDLAERGYLCWNVDYRSGAAPWPATLSDVAAAYDHLGRGRLADRVDPQRIAVVGHSAGGHLAAWLAGRAGREPTATGDSPLLPPPALCVPQSGVLALATAARQLLGDGAVEDFVGGSPETRPDRYTAADPVARVPTGVRCVVIHTAADTTVPVGQGREYAATARAAGDDCRLVVVPGDHYAHLDPAGPASDRLRVALAWL